MFANDNFKYNCLEMYSLFQQSRLLPEDFPNSCREITMLAPQRSFFKVLNISAAR